METVSEFVRVVDLAGVLANAILGGIVARAARLDIVGFVVLAVLSGLGGGMIRDALLQQGPVAALVDPRYLAFAVAGAAIAFVIPFRRKLSMRALILLDALAIGCWANVGAQKTLAAGLMWPAAIALGVITAIGGGIVRDVVLRKIPSVFGGSTLYATSAFVAGVVTVVCYSFDVPEIGSIVAIVSAAALLLASRWFKWGLPLALEPRTPRQARTASRWLRGWWSGRGRTDRDGTDHPT